MSHSRVTGFEAFHGVACPRAVFCPDGMACDGAAVKAEWAGPEEASIFGDRCEAAKRPDLMAAFGGQSCEEAYEDFVEWRKEKARMLGDALFAPTEVLLEEALRSEVRAWLAWELAEEREYQAKRQVEEESQALADAQNAGRFLTKAVCTEEEFVRDHGPVKKGIVASADGAHRYLVGSDGHFFFQGVAEPEKRGRSFDMVVMDEVVPPPGLSEDERKFLKTQEDVYAWAVRMGILPEKPAGAPAAAPKSKGWGRHSFGCDGCPDCDGPPERDATGDPGRCCEEGIFGKPHRCRKSPGPVQFSEATRPEEFPAVDCAHVGRRRIYRGDPSSAGHILLEDGCVDCGHDFLKEPVMPDGRPAVTRMEAPARPWHHSPKDGSRCEGALAPLDVPDVGCAVEECLVCKFRQPVLGLGGLPIFKMPAEKPMAYDPAAKPWTWQGGVPAVEMGAATVGLRVVGCARCHLRLFGSFCHSCGDRATSFEPRPGRSGW